MLQLEHRVRVEQVVLALAAPLVFAADLQLAVRRLLRTRQEGETVTTGDVVGDLVQSDALDGADRPGEVLVAQILGQPGDVEELGAGVGGQRRDAHLGHHLEHALGRGLAEVRAALGGVDRGDVSGLDHLVDGLEDHVRVDRVGAVAEQCRDVVHLAGVTGLDDQTDPGAGLLPDQVVVHGRGQQQRRDRRVTLVGLAVGQHDDGRTLVDGLGDLATDPVQCDPQSATTVGQGVQAPDHRGGELRELAVVVGVDDGGQLVVGQHRVVQHDLTAAVRPRLQQVGLGAEHRAVAGDQFLADGVQRRVRHLGEPLGEVVEQRLATRGQHRDRRVGTHRTEGLGTALGHRREEDAQLLLGVPEDALAQHHAIVAHLLVGRLRQTVERGQSGVQPLLVGVLAGQLALDLLVADDPAGGGVDQEHPARLQTGLGDHLLLRDVEHPDLGGHDHQTVLGDPDPGGAQTVTVQHGPDHGAVGEGDGGRSVPGLHEGGVVLVERPLRGVHVGVALPGLRDHHQHRVRQAAPAQRQQFQRLVEPGGVRTAGGADRQGLLQLRQGDRVHQGLTGPHPVLVTAGGVDLTVVCHVAERMRQRPGREGVGGEARVHDGQGRLHPLVLQVEVEVG